MQNENKEIGKAGSSYLQTHSKLFILGAILNTIIILKLKNDKVSIIMVQHKQDSAKFDSIDVENIVIQYNYTTKNSIFFIYKLDRASLSPESVQNLEYSISLKIPIPVKAYLDKDFIIFQGLLFAKNNLKQTLSNIVKTINSFYLPNRSEGLQALSNQISEGIKNIGFNCAKCQKTINKHVYLYAINDNCNDCRPEWKAIPFLLEVRENALIAKVLFSLNSKPAQFSQEPDDYLSIFKSKPEKKQNSEGLKNFKGLENYLQLSHDEFLPISSKFSKKSENKDLAVYPNLYIKMLNELMNFSKDYIGNWKFNYDKNKNQVFMKYSMKPLYPLHLNKHIPQLLTSEAITYFTGFCHGIYEIYSLSQRKKRFSDETSYKSFMKNLKKTCKKRSKKPIVNFTLLDMTNNNTISFDEQKIKNIELLNTIRKNPLLSKIFSAKHIKGDFLPYIKFIKTSDLKSLNLPSNSLKPKTLKKLCKMIFLLLKQGFDIKYKKIPELFFVKSGNPYYNHEKPIEYFIKKEKNDSQSWQIKYNKILSFVESGNPYYNHEKPIEYSIKYEKNDSQSLQIKYNVNLIPCFSYFL